MGMVMTTEGLVSSKGLLKLMTWLSPSFPVGGYTYSHGLEYAVEDRLIVNWQSLAEWVEGILSFGLGKTDAIVFAAAWTAVREDDQEGLMAVVELADVLRPSAEMALESAAQGKAFLKAVTDIWPHALLTRWQSDLRDFQRDPAYPVAVGVVAALHDAPLHPALTAYLHAVAANLISAGVRLIPLGQTTGLKALEKLEKPILDAASAALKASLEDIGSAAPMVDWTSMKHETQYTRLFRS